MGAIASLLAFDLDRHRRVVVPALRQFLLSGEQRDGLEAILAEYYRNSLASEARNPAFYARHPRVSEQLGRLEAGLGIDLSAVCTCLDQDLGASHASVAELAAILPGLEGGCDAAACREAQTCPFHRLVPKLVSTDLLMRLFQQMVLSSCRPEPAPLHLGRHFRFYDVQAWYGAELGLEDEAAKQFFNQAIDPLCLLLARLFKRGGIWGWADGGHGEGLLGWLDAPECLSLADRLDAYHLSQAPDVLPDASLDAADRQRLLEIRCHLAELSCFAQACGRQQLGMLLQLA